LRLPYETKEFIKGVFQLRVGIIGGGVAGLSAACELSKRNIRVTLYEKSHVLGGLASFFPLDNGFIERYYHFVCLGDDVLFSLLDELKIKNNCNKKNTVTSVDNSAFAYVLIFYLFYAK